MNENFLKVMDGRLCLNPQMMTTAEKNDTAVIHAYGEIASEKWWGDETTPKDVLEQINQNGTPKFIHVHINSPGGSAFAGVTIYNVLKNHPAQVTVFVDGWAASAASVIAMAGDEIVMGNGTMMMIHNPLTALVGYYKASELLDVVDKLEKMAEAFAPIYSERTGKDVKEIRQLMDAETWFTAAEAVELGFATEVSNSLQMVACALSEKQVEINGVEMDVSGFDHAPKMQILKPEVKEVKKMDKDQLMKEFPELFNSVMAEGVKLERERIQKIEELTNPDNKELALTAKFGEKPQSAADFAMASMEKIKQDRAELLSKFEGDGNDLNNKLPDPVGDPLPTTGNENDQKLIDKAIESANRKRG